MPINATWDNFSDFLVLGGCRGAFWANGEWGPRMVAYNFTPPLAPDPDGRLARLWRERLEHAQPWCLDWYDARDETARWAAREIRAERITAATLAVCGWWDFYSQGTLDYFARLGGPKKLLLGPWKRVGTAAEDVLRRAAGRPGHIFNLGHGVLPDTDPDALGRLCALVHERTASAAPSPSAPSR